MVVTIFIQYHTHYGQEIFLKVYPSKNRTAISHQVDLHYYNEQYWKATLNTGELDIKSKFIFSVLLDPSHLRLALRVGLAPERHQPPVVVGGPGPVTTLLVQRAEAAVGAGQAEAVLVELLPGRRLLLRPRPRRERGVRAAREVVGAGQQVAVAVGAQG